MLICETKVVPLKPAKKNMTKAGENAENWLPKVRREEEQKLCARLDGSQNKAVCHENAYISYVLFDTVVTSLNNTRSL